MSNTARNRLRTGKVHPLKVVRIGNSRGVRLPTAILARYAMGDSVIAEERSEGVLLRANNDRRLGWEQTYRSMAREREDWSDMEATDTDGLDESSS